MSNMLKDIKKNIWLVILDIIAVNAAFIISLFLRYYVDSKFLSSSKQFAEVYFSFAPFYTILCIIIFVLFKLYNGIWQYASLDDLNRVLLANLVTLAGNVAGTCIFFRPMPRSYYLLGTLLQIILTVGIRFSYRLFVFEQHKLMKNRENAIVIGLGDVGRYLVKLLDEGTTYRPVCVIDTNGTAQGRSMNGLPVYDTANLKEAIDKYEAKYIFIAHPELRKQERDEIKTICEKNNLIMRDYSAFFSFEGESDSFTGMMNVVKGPVHDGKKSIPFSPPDIGESEIGEVIEALKSGWITTGPRTKLLERRLAAYIETGRTDVDTESEPDRWKNRVVCLNSATAGEELDFRVLGIGPGDEVIIPAYTYTASASAAIHCGAKIVFVDIQKDGNPFTHMPEMDFDAFEAAITERTKAVVVVDLGGIVADYDRVYEIVERKKNIFKPLESDGTPLRDLNSRIQHAIGRVAVVADSAHSLGASRLVGGERKYCGAIADFTAFSFHAVKNFTTAEGGASTWKPIDGVSNAEIYKMFQLLSLHGQNKDALAKTKVGAWEYDIIGPWYKCNMTDIMAAIGLRQLDRYLGLLDRRVEIMKKYDAVCDELGISHLVHHTGDMDSSNHLYLIRVPGFDEEERNRVIELMAGRGVATNVHYKPLPMMTAYGKDCTAYPNAYDYYKNLITLPLHTLLSDEDVDYVCSSLREVMRKIKAC